MRPLKFKSKVDEHEMIIVDKSIFRILDRRDMPYGDNQADGKVYEYTYDVISHGELYRLDEDELQECMQQMQFVGFEQ